MLNNKTFKDGIEKLVIEYGDRGFAMSKGRAAQWYEYVKGMADKQFNKQIDDCLTNCRHVPFMADVFEGFEFPEKSIYTDRTNYIP